MATLTENTGTTGFQYLSHRKDDAKKLVSELLTSMSVYEDGTTIFKTEYVTITYDPAVADYPYELLSREGVRTRCPSFEMVLSTIMKKWW